jgi:endonuclease/exonuclease/phosphatase family metal-dependent hydrolase
MFRIASFNVENLFARPKAFRSSDHSIGKPILDAYKRFNDLIRKPSYSAADKRSMRDLLVQLDVYTLNDQGAVRRKQVVDPTWAWLRKNRGTFDTEPKDKSQSMEITATGRGDWIGWIELANEPTNETGTRMTARVIADVDADILGVIEAEDRPSLVRFNEDLLAKRYKHVMLIDGNDDRGIDVAILTKPGFEIANIRSNVDAEDAQGEIFSRDCPQYEVVTPSGVRLHVLVNHFKSQSGGGGPKRLRQAQRVRKIADELVAAGQHVVVLGDLNEGPKAGKAFADNLAPLYTGSSPLVDCWSLPSFDDGGKPGSYGACSLSNRLDYILLSKSLVPSVAGGGLERSGLWGDRVSRPTDWDTYEEMTSGIEQASDHAALFVDLNL